MVLEFKQKLKEFEVLQNQNMWNWWSGDKWFPSACAKNIPVSGVLLQDKAGEICEPWVSKSLRHQMDS